MSITSHLQVVLDELEAAITAFNAEKYAFMLIGPYDWTSHDFSRKPRATSLFIDYLRRNTGSTPGYPPGTMTMIASIELYASTASAREDGSKNYLHAELLTDAVAMFREFINLKRGNDNIFLGLKDLDFLPVTFSGVRGRPQGIIMNIEATF